MTPRPAQMAMLHCGSHAQLATLADPALEPHRIRPVHARTGAVTELDDVDGVLGENRVDSWLPGAREHRRPTIFWWWRTGEDSRIRRTHTGHPAAEWFTDKSLTWHYHGVLEPPEGAVSLVDLHTTEGELDGSLLYVDETSTAGRLLVTTMDPVYHHGSGFMPGATQLLYSALRWASEGRR